MYVKLPYGSPVNSKKTLETSKVRQAASDQTIGGVFAVMTASFVQVLDIHFSMKGWTNWLVQLLGEAIRTLAGVHLQSGREPHPSASPGTLACSQKNLVRAAFLSAWSSRSKGWA